MRIIRFVDDHGNERWGHDLHDNTAAPLEGELLTGLRPSTSAGTGASAGMGPGRVPVARLLAPVVPRAILCVGLNYRDHARETGQPLPERPVLFMKNPAAVQDPGEPIRLLTAFVDRPEVDFEVELAVVLGRAARDVSTDTALDYVVGYTIANDVSARRVQKHGGGGQWVRGKSYDTFCPLGPVLVTPEDIPDPQALHLTTRLNGEVMQDSSTAEMIFSVAELIADLSTGTTLLPGTVLLTGTPHGVGFARDPRVFLKPGDLLELEIEGIGTLRNPVAHS
jgi:2-keto-4-pentenoate hydratase/2-oxohepta-3-ene-1,7-dioic acid hydratase in catechol pathway